MRLFSHECRFLLAPILSLPFLIPLPPRIFAPLSPYPPYLLTIALQAPSARSIPLLFRCMMYGVLIDNCPPTDCPSAVGPPTRIQRRDIVVT
jgi:hypothetical protein